MDMTYNGDCEQATETRDCNLAGTLLVGTCSYTYDGAGEITNLRKKNSLFAGPGQKIFSLSKRMERNHER
jgi:hypothetical protein